MAIVIAPIWLFFVLEYTLSYFCKPKSIFSSRHFYELGEKELKSLRENLQNDKNFNRIILPSLFVFVSTIVKYWIVAYALLALVFISKDFSVWFYSIIVAIGVFVVAQKNSFVELIALWAVTYFSISVLFGFL